MQRNARTRQTQLQLSSLKLYELSSLDANLLAIAQQDDHAEFGQLQSIALRCSDRNNSATGDSWCHSTSFNANDRRLCEKSQREGLFVELRKLSLHVVAHYVV